jgi:hypothetical protein
MYNSIEPAETFYNKIQQNESSFISSLNNYKMCYVNFNINDANANIQCSNIDKTSKNCTDCLKTSETTILENISEIQNIQKDILHHIEPLLKIKPIEEDNPYNDADVSNLVNRYNTTNEMLDNSVETYKIYRIQLITETIKLLILLFIIFSVLNNTKGVKIISYISVITYITLSALEVFFTGTILLAINILSFIFFMICFVLNINDIRVNYQTIKDKTTESISNISSELQKSVNIQKL